MTIPSHHGALRPADAASADGRERAFDALPQKDAAVALLQAINNVSRARTRPPASGPVVLAGASEESRQAERLLAHLGIPVACVLDDAEQAPDPSSDAASEDAADQELKEAALVAVTDTSVPFEESARRLAEAGWRTILPFADVADLWRERHPLSDGWHAGRLRKKDLARAQRVIGGWSDAASRAHHLRLAAWRMLRAEWHFDGAPVVPGEAFFIPEVARALTPEERLLDVGAYHGGVCLRFAERPGGQFGAIWAVEPDPTARAIIAAEIASRGSLFANRIAVLDHVLGATAGPVPFRDGYGPGSQCGEGGCAERAMVALDDLGLDPTFLTIDVNGHEIGVLEGARETLERTRPIVAVDVGRGPDGLWRSGAWLMKALQDYRFLMRLHGWHGTRAIVYAIPEERAAER